MNYRIITKIASKLMALCLFITTASYLPSTLFNIYQAFTQYQNEYTSTGIISMEITLLLRLLAAILLWIYADKISILITKDIDADTNYQDIDYKKLQCVAFTVVGLVLFISSIQIFGSSIFMYQELLSKGMMMKGTKEYYTNLTKIISSGVQLLFGLLLLIGSRGFVNVLIYIRNLGIDRIEEKKL